QRAAARVADEEYFARCLPAPLIGAGLAAAEPRRRFASIRQERGGRGVLFGVVDLDQVPAAAEDAARVAREAPVARRVAERVAGASIQDRAVGAAAALAERSAFGRDVAYTGIIPRHVTALRVRRADRGHAHVA